MSGKFPMKIAALSDSNPVSCLVFQNVYTSSQISKMIPQNTTFFTIYETYIFSRYPTPYSHQKKTAVAPSFPLHIPGEGKMMARAMCVLPGAQKGHIHGEVSPLALTFLPIFWTCFPNIFLGCFPYIFGDI